MNGTRRVGPLLAAIPLVVLFAWFLARSPEKPEPLPGHGGSEKVLPLPSAAAVGAASRTAPERFEGNGVYTYLDGGAEAYLERGLQEIVVARYLEVAAGEDTHEVEAAAMRFATREGASAQCAALAPETGTPVDGLDGATATNSELTVSRGRWLLRLVCDDPRSDARPFLVRIASAWTAMVGADDDRG